MDFAPKTVQSYNPSMTNARIAKILKQNFSRIKNHNFAALPI